MGKMRVNHLPVGRQTHLNFVTPNNNPVDFQLSTAVSAFHPCASRVHGLTQTTCYTRNYEVLEAGHFSVCGTTSSQPLCPGLVLL